MAHLMYDSKTDILVNRVQLNQLETPAARGRFHNPIGFGEYVDLVDHAMEQNGLKLVNPEYAVTKDHNRFFGLAEVEPLEGELITADDWKLTVGLRGSHDQKIPRGLTLGSQVMVCSNLCFSGDLATLQTKQTLNIWTRLPEMIRQAVSQIPELAHVQEQKFDAYKNHVFNSPRHGDAFIVEAFRRGGLTAAQMGTAVKEWDQPKHEEHAEYGYSAWRLLNACTEALKPSGDSANHDTIRQRSIAISSFLDEVTGISF